MANGVKEYKIVINGIQESVNAVESLNKQLNDLEQRIETLNKNGINLSGNGKNDTRVSKQLNDQDKLEKRILETERKLSEVRDENYKKLLHMKEELREYTQIAKSQVAAEANQQGLFDPNTMAGMKAQLKSIKQEMQTVEIGGDRFQELTRQANELNNKLKQIEQSYGQFGRNVGNYADGVAKGMQAIKININGVEREFANAREASRTLNNELKSMAVNGQRNTKEYKELQKAVAEFNSTCKDATVSSSAMNNILHTMQGFVAVASVSQGLSSFLGIEDDEKMQRSLQRLIGIQNALIGIEKINQQVNERVGIGAWLAKVYDGADKLASKLQTLTARFEAFYINTRSGLAGKNGNASRLLGIDADDILKIARDPETFNQQKQDIINMWSKRYMSTGMEASDAFAKAEKNMNRLLAGVNLTTKAFKVMRGVVSTIFTGGLLLFLPEIIEGFSNLASNLFTAKVQAENAEMAINSLNKALQTQMDLISSSYLKGWINDERFLTDVYKAQTDALIKQIDALQQRAATIKETFDVKSLKGLENFFSATQSVEFRGQKFNGEATVGAGRSPGTWFVNGNDLEYTVKSIGEVEKAWRECNQAIAEGKDYFDKWGTGFKGWYNSLFATMKDTEEVMRGMGNIKLSDTIADFQQISEQFNKGQISAEQYQKELARLRNEMNNNEILNSVIANLDKYIPDDKVRTAVQNIINEIYRLDDAFNMTSPEQIHYWNQVRIDAMKDGYAKAKAQIDENERYEIQQKAHTEEQVTLLHNKYNRQRQEAQERYNKKNQKSAKSSGKKLQDIENELIALRIENMKNGMEKALAQIENERRVALQKAKENGKLVGEMTLEINKKYDQKILEEKRKWAFDMVKTYEDLEARIEQINRSTFETETSTATQKVRSREKANIYSTGYDFITPATFDDTKTLEEYYRKVLKIQEETAEKEQTIRQDSLDRMLEYDQKEEELRHKRLIDENGGEYIQQLRAGLITQEEYDTLIEKEGYAHTARMNALQRQYEAESSASTEEYLDSIYSMYDAYWGNIVNNIRNDYDKITETLDRQPVKDKYGWGIINIGATSTAYNKALDMYDELKNEIIKKQMELSRALNEHRISAEDFAIRQSELTEEMKAIDNTIIQVKERQREVVGYFMQSIQQYIQAGLQTISELMRSVWEYQDAEYEHQMDLLDKHIDKYAELLEKQKDITQKYADEVDSIEDELADARGDRRQHLIDQLNAEISAQRASIAEEKRMEKQKKALEEKKEQEEIKQRKREHDRQVTQAFINWHLSVANALTTQPFMPVGIAMGALATALGAAQYALVKSQKYADGGVIQGKSHKDGGVKVLGGRAEVEGGEFITNKRTTEQNIDLLEYINKKKRRVDLNDLIEFYSSGKVKKNINKMSPTRYLADGGYIPPTLNNDIDIDNRILSAIESYSRKPTVVQVVDIVDKMDNLKNVQVLAGLTPSY